VIKLSINNKIKNMKKLYSKPRNLRKKWQILPAVLVLTLLSGMSVSKVFAQSIDKSNKILTFSASSFNNESNWSVPAGVKVTKIETWGGGGGGAHGKATGPACSGAGGGGAGYATIYSLNFTHNTSFKVRAGRGAAKVTSHGNGNDGQDSWVKNSSGTNLVYAQSGKGGHYNGLAISGGGDGKGGAYGSGSYNSAYQGAAYHGGKGHDASGLIGTGGGSAAGASCDGTTGSSTAGVDVYPSCGDNPGSQGGKGFGGVGGTFGAGANAGEAQYGGGGGGSYTGGAGGGGDGVVRMFYSCNISNITISASSTSVESGAQIELSCTTVKDLSSGEVVPGTYTWNNDLGVGQSKSANPTSDVTYTVTYTNDYGCQKTASVSVTISYPVPTFTSRAEMYMACAGEVVKIEVDGLPAGYTYAVYTQQTGGNYSNSSDHTLFNKTNSSTEYAWVQAISSGTPVGARLQVPVLASAFCGGSTQDQSCGANGTSGTNLYY